MRTTLLALAALTALSACSAAPEPASPSAAASASAPASAAATPSPTGSPSVDNTAVGEAMADSATTARAILEGVWTDTPQAKREGTCQRWANTPQEVYEVPLFAEMDRDVVKAYFDKVCAAL